jgi:ferric-dicitrate binding protein FerR (iron transport regulator)
MALKILRQSLVSILTLAMVVPAWGANDVVGTAVQTQSATVHQAALAAGSTVFSGDAITAAVNGRAQVALPGGGRVDVLSNSTVRVERNTDGVQLTLERGSAGFQTRPDSPVQALLTDATVRAPNNGSAMALIGMESPDSALVVARIGALEVITEHDSKSVLIPEGSAARITLLPEEPAQQQAGTQPAGRKRRRLAMVLILAGGGVTAGAILAATGGSSTAPPVSPSAP